MKSLPRIRLRTIFLLFICAAVGLAIGLAPIQKIDPSLGLGWHEPRYSLIYSLLAAASVAVIIGLLNEITVLWQWAAPAGDASDGMRFARAFAIVWRSAIAALLSVCLITALLISRYILELPDTETFLSYEAFPYVVWVVCLIVVLSVSLLRRQQSKQQRPPTWQLLTILFAGAIAAALILPDIGLVHFLVHVAAAGIEHAQPAEFQTVGSFPDLRAERFTLFWLTMAAQGALIVAGANLLLANKYSAPCRWRLLLTIVGYTASLSVAAAFCVWYYGFELHRISPYLAEARVGSNPLEWCAALALVGVIATIAAYELTSLESSSIDTRLNRENELYLETVYESPACLLLLVGSVALYIYETIQTHVSMAPLVNMLTGQVNIAFDIVLGMIREPCLVLMIAIMVLSLQLLWMCWRRREEKVAWIITEVNPRRFLWNWLAIAALSCVAIPTISEYAFVVWLGPWYLIGR
jgi:hypothetical protein